MQYFICSVYIPEMHVYSGLKFIIIKVKNTEKIDALSVKLACDFFYCGVFNFSRLA